MARRDPLAEVRPPALVVDDALAGYLGEVVELDAHARVLTRLGKPYTREVAASDLACQRLLDATPPPSASDAAVAWFETTAMRDVLPVATSALTPIAREVRRARARVVFVLARAAAVRERGQDRLAELCATGELDEELEDTLAEALSLRGAALTPRVHALFEAWLALANTEPGRLRGRATRAVGWAIASLPPARAFDLLAPVFEPLDETRAFPLLVAVGVDWAACDPRWRAVLTPLATHRGLGSHIPQQFR